MQARGRGGEDIETSRWSRVNRRSLSPSTAQIPASRFSGFSLIAPQIARSSPPALASRRASPELDQSGRTNGRGTPTWEHDQAPPTREHDAHPCGASPGTHGTSLPVQEGFSGGSAEAHEDPTPRPQGRHIWCTALPCTCSTERLRARDHRFILRAQLALALVPCLSCLLHVRAVAASKRA